MSAVISIAFLSPECLPILVKEVFFIEELYYGIVYHQLCLGLPPCHHLKIYILILIDFFFVLYWFCCSLFFVLCLCFVVIIFLLLYFFVCIMCIANLYVYMLLLVVCVMYTGLR